MHILGLNAFWGALFSKNTMAIGQILNYFKKALASPIAFKAQVLIIKQPRFTGFCFLESLY